MTKTTIIQIAERLRAKVARKDRDLVSGASEFDFPPEFEEGDEVRSGKTLEYGDGFDIVEVPALTVWQFVIISVGVTLMVTVIGGLTVLVVARAIGL